MDSSEIFFQREQTLQIKRARFSKIPRWINERPRETLNDKTAIEAIKKLLSNINVASAS